MRRSNSPPSFFASCELSPFVGVGAMGKRKSSTSKSMAAPRKPQPKLDTEFTCPFRDHPNGVDCRIDLKHGFAEASCRVCKESYCTSANALTAAVDVYCEWIDECEKANEGVDVRKRRREDYEDGV